MRADGQMVRPAKRSASWRVLAHFLLIGLVLLGARKALSRASEPLVELVVTVPRAASSRAVEIAVDEEILVDLALREGWAESELVVRDRLARNMRFAGDGTANDDGEALLARAAELGMDRSDPVVRRYLSTLARRALGASPRDTVVSDGDLLAYARAHRERYTRPASVRFSHVFVSAERHGGDLDAAAARLGARLAAGVAPQAVAELSDPTLLPLHPAALDEGRIDARFGRGFGAQVLLAPVGRWSGPLRSSFGLHFVWVHERSAAELPALGDMRAALSQDLRREQREARVRGALTELRSRYRLRLERTP